MTRPFKVVAVSGNVQRPSRTLVLVEELIAAIGDVLPIEAHTIELGPLAPQIGGALYRSQLPASVDAELAAIESADLLIVASPVYRGAYTGLFKHLFDFVHQDALIDVPVLLAATGGSDRHALVIDHQLRPLFSFFQARTLPIGVYASEQDFTGYAVGSARLKARIALAAERAAPLVGVAPAAAAGAVAAPRLALAA
ncbi:FMN reductase [Acidovorax sp. FG27]|uniref:FMN reductase n=1 Tax=Acidovorax sp. FG27 TaxID=3133652 RepID=UPI0030EA77EF